MLGGNLGSLLYGDVSIMRLPPRHSKSMAAVCPGKLSRDLALKSHPKRLEKPGIKPTTPGIQGE